jgi:hypothetical protein
MEVKSWDSNTWSLKHYAMWGFGQHLLFGAHFAVCGCLAPRHFLRSGVCVWMCSNMLMHARTALTGLVAVHVVGPLLITLGFGTWEPIPPRGKLHVIPSLRHGRDWWYMA